MNGVGDDNTSPPSAGAGRRPSMTEQESKERRASIQAIMKDPNLTAQERRKSIQYLMDGRRRSSVKPPPSNNGEGLQGVAAAAALAAADFVDSSDDEDEDNDEGMHDDTNNNALNGSKRVAKKRRSSLMFKSGSTQLSNLATTPEKITEEDYRRASLRESFTMGFSNLGMKKEEGGDFESSTSNNGSMMSGDILSRKMEKSRPSCSHYERNCSIVSPCCGLVFGCRICHDDTEELPPPFLISGGGMTENNDTCPPVAATGTSSGTFASSMTVAASTKPPVLSHRSASLPGNFEEEETHHEINRFLIKEVICRECFTRQSSKTNNCINCGTQFGTYHCSICNLWMSADEDPYHCMKCGFCRVGGRENFTHCDDCGMCIDALLFDDHNCKSGKYMSNCPVCQEDLFSSRMASHEMPCGHAIHWHCFRELTSHDTRCPVCKKTAETHDQMEQTWNAMAMGIALQPVPSDMARVVDILCNDCEGKSENQRWHFLGVQCRRCTSFNTTVERTVLVGEEAATFLGPATDIATLSSSASTNVSNMNQNVLTALMGGGAAALQGGNGDMDTEALNQSVAAEVMGIMNGTTNETSFPSFGGVGQAEDEDDEMDQS